MSASRLYAGPGDGIVGNAPGRRSSTRAAGATGDLQEGAEGEDGTAHRRPRPHAPLRAQPPPSDEHDDEHRPTDVDLVASADAVQRVAEAEARLLRPQKEGDGVGREDVGP